jgi:WD40 repeat protein
MVTSIEKVVANSSDVKRARLAALSNLVKSKKSGHLEKYFQLLTDFDFLAEKIHHPEFGLQALIEDYDLIDELPLGREEPSQLPLVRGENISLNPEKVKALKRIQGALRLSAHVLAKDKTQLVEQLWGRMQCFDVPEIQQLLSQAKQSKTTWLRPLTLSLTSPDEPLIRTFTGHRGSVWSVAVPDGEQVISGSQDGTLKIWNLNTGKLVRKITAHDGSINAISTTLDGLQVISGSHDKTLKVWNLKTGELVDTLIGHYGSVNAVVLTPDGSKLISGSSDCSLKVWDLKSAEVLYTLVGHRASVTAATIVFTQNKQWLISGSYNDTLRVWNLETGREELTLGERDMVRSIAVLDGERVISASEDGSLTVWKVGTWEKECTLKGHSKPVCSVAVLPDRKQIISGSSDGTIKIWKIGTWENKATFTAHTAWVLAVAVTPDGKQIISASGNNLSNENVLKVWNIEQCSIQFSSNNAHGTKNGHSDSVEVIAFTPEGKEVISASKDGTFKIWEVGTWKNKAIFEGQSNSTDARGDYEEHKYFNLEANEVKCFLHSTRNTLPFLLATTADGKVQVWASGDETIKVWDASARRFIANFTGESEIKCCGIAPDGVTIVAGEVSGRLHFLRLESMDT